MAVMASASLVSASSSTWLSARAGKKARVPNSSLSLVTGTRRTVSDRNVAVSSSARAGLLHCSFVPSASSALSFPSSISGLALGLNFNSTSDGNKRRGLVVTAAGRQALCLTKRSRSRKSLARTHGFRLRMRTTSGRAVLKRRRAKGRKILCTKTNPNSGKR